MINDGCDKNRHIVRNIECLWVYVVFDPLICVLTYGPPANLHQRFRESFLKRSNLLPIDFTKYNNSLKVNSFKMNSLSIFQFNSFASKTKLPFLLAK